MTGEVIPVADAADERLAPYRHLTDAGRRRTTEAADGIFVVEGRLAVAHLLASPYPVRSLLVSSARAGRLGPLVDAVGAAGAPVYVAPPDVLAATVGFNLHRGVVAVAGRRPPADPASVLAAAGEPSGSRPPIVLVAEGVNDHENLGSLFRNAAAFGAGAVLLDPTTADPFYRRCVRVSMGLALRVPVARFTAWPDGLATASAAGFEVVALTPGGAAALEDEPADRPVALLVGAEGPGLSAAALDAADRRVRIAIATGVDSLNVATAAAIALHHYRAHGPSPTSPPHLG